MKKKENVIQENITVSNGDAIALLSNPIWKTRDLPVKTRYWLSRIGDKLQSIARAASAERDKIIKDLCDKDADGKPVEKAGKVFFTDPARQTEANNALAELMKIENTIPWPRLIIDVALLPETFAMNATEMAEASPVAEFVFNEPKPEGNPDAK